LTYVWTVVIEDDGHDIIHDHGPSIVVFDNQEKAESYCCEYIKEFLVEDFDKDFFHSICEQDDIDLILERIKNGDHGGALEHFLDIFHDHARVPYLEKHEVK
jgi:hypothetical protein